jgi:acetyl-CoA carboxylase biotin carboxylase subunit
VEKYLENARHFEVQTLGDNHGNAVHLYERDCSSQRRHQKLVEEAPSPGVDPKKRDKVCESAASLIQKAKYCGAATVEFLMDKHQDFYMLEVNTRVQVEHPVTELITGVDVVQTQIRVAAGEKLPFAQKDIRVNGHAIEVRINAEDPDRGFMPQAGLIEQFAAPGGPGVRLDSHARAGYRIPSNYDSMIGKLIVHGHDRDAAIVRMRPLGVTTLKRMDTMPNLPTIAESGVPGFEASTWHGMGAVNGTPRAVQQKLNVEVNAVLKDPQVAKFLESQGAIIEGGSAEKFAAHIKAEIPKWAKVIKDSGARAD